LGFVSSGRWLWRGLALAMLAAVAGCSGSSSSVPEPAPDLRAQLAELPLPAGADAAQFAQLKHALAVMLDSGAVKTTSAPPNKPNAAVDDFEMVQGQDNVTFTWSYKNPGDYNRDGEVNVSDLSVLGKYLGANVNSANWDQARVADGTDDGEVNLGDLTPLGSNMMSSVQGYKLRYTETPQDESSFTVLVDIPLGDATLDQATGALVFSYSIRLGDLPTRTAYWQVTPYEGTQLGIGSNSDTLLDLPPVISKVQPISGKSGQAITFTADVFGTQLSYDWDFGGAGTPNTSDQAAPVVTLGAGGSYSGTLIVSNPQGSDTFQFAITVVDNKPPTVSLSANPNAGPGPLTVVLTADADDPDGAIASYAWDLNGDSKFEATSDGNTNTAVLTKAGGYRLSVKVSDTDGATAVDTVSVTVAALPAAVINASTSQVVAPDSIAFDATGSSSPNGAIVKYEWDWDGNGTIDASTRNSPRFSVAFDAPVGTYKPTVYVTDDTGAKGSASTTVSVTGTKFIAPPVETYVDLSSPNDTAKERWLKNTYSTLPEWQDANGPYQSAYFRGWADQVFALMNARRVAAGLSPCQRLLQLDVLSQAHERDQALRSYFSHTTPEGMDHHQRIKAINPPPNTYTWGEIIAQGQEDPMEVVDQWMNSPAHKAIIMLPELTYAGVGVFWKTNGTKGLESYTGMFFAGFHGAPDPTYHWLAPEDVL
jgi:uncharacterized protein YkwD